MPNLIPAHLPKRLTISFPIWGLMHTYEDSVYADLDQFVREHVERSFNCIRLESLPDSPTTFTATVVGRWPWVLPSTTSTFRCAK